MLVLTRKQQEKIRIGDDIVITVLRMKGKSVRLGIEAPPEVPVLRGELAFEIEAEEEAARRVTNDAAQLADGLVDPTNESETRSMSKRAEHDHPSTDVRLHRVPRDQAAQVVPQLLQDAGPLRAMLDLRNSVNS